MELYINIQNEGHKFECCDVFKIDRMENKYCFLEQIPVSEYKALTNLFFVLSMKYNFLKVYFFIDKNIEPCVYMDVDREVDQLF